MNWAVLSVFEVDWEIVERAIGFVRSLRDHWLGNSQCVDSFLWISGPSKVQRFVTSNRSDRTMQNQQLYHYENDTSDQPYWNLFSFFSLWGETSERKKNTSEQLPFKPGGIIYCCCCCCCCCCRFLPRSNLISNHSLRADRATSRVIVRLIWSKVR